MHVALSVKAVPQIVLGLRVSLGKLISPAEIERASTQVLSMMHAHAPSSLA
jgi:hypothetical protein